MNKTIATVIILVWSQGCREAAVPKPRGYFRIDLPAKEYTLLKNDPGNKSLPFSFEYPAYGRIAKDINNASEPGWFNIEFPDFKAKIYLTYKDVKDDLPELVEQTYTMNVKNHITKADAIDQQVISNQANKVYGVLYDLKGNTATSVQFYVTDSLKHYLRGSLYFDTEPNPDSLAPVTDFFREDIIHLISTLTWQE